MHEVSQFYISFAFSLLFQITLLNIATKNAKNENEQNQIKKKKKKNEMKKCTKLKGIIIELVAICL